MKLRRQFEIEIRDLAIDDVAACAEIHQICFPNKIETILGNECIQDCLRTRYIAPHGDCVSRVAVDRESGRVAAYLHAEPMRPGDNLSNAFLNSNLARKHLLRRGWYRPRVWAWFARRLWRKLFARDWNEGTTLDIRPNWEVAKMLGIHPDFRGGNIGVDLMRDNEAEAQRRGAQRICGLIERSNIKAERLYASVGWVRTSTNSDHYEVFAMHRDLTEAVADPESEQRIA